MASKAHNDLRAKHCAEKYTVDSTMAKEMQKLLDANQRASTKAERTKPYKECQENFYTAPTGTTDKDVMNKNLATTYWSSMKSGYNYKTGVGSNKAATDQFTRVVWNIKAGKFAFARRGQYIMAWYCPSGKEPGINMGAATAYIASVKPDTCPKTCTDNLAGDLYSKCYNMRATASHNTKRRTHKVPELKMDIDIAKRAQALAKQYATGGSFTINASEPCGYNIASAPDTTKASNKDWATDYWYKTGAGYNWASVKFSSAEADFTKMIWRSSTKVGFGVYGTKVVALYCIKGNVKNNFECNVCKANVGCDAVKCPEADAICSSTNGEGRAEISLRADNQSIRVIATVKKGQNFSIAFGSRSIVNSDLITFYAG